MTTNYSIKSTPPTNAKITSTILKKMEQFILYLLNKTELIASTIKYEIIFDAHHREFR